jgi:hypothetical protein
MARGVAYSLKAIAPTERLPCVFAGRERFPPSQGLLHRGFAARVGDLMPGTAPDRE